MASTSLLLANPKAEKSSIVCQLRDGRDVKIKIASGISVKTKHWSKKNNKVLSSDYDATAKNRSLLKLKQHLLDAYLEAKENGQIVDAAFLRSSLKPKEKVSPEHKEFWNVWGYYLEEKKDHFSKSSFKKFATLQKHFQNFEASTKTPFAFDTINRSRLEKLQSYFYDNGINTQTTSKYIGGLKMFLNWAVENKYSTNLDFKSFKPIVQKDSLKVALENNEVDLIRKVILDSKPYLENVRQLFLLSILTGLRFSDYSRLKKEHLKRDSDGSYILQIRQQKTADMVDLPLTMEAEQIIRKLIDGEVHAISNQKMNNYVKELCQLAGIDEPFETHRFVGKMSSSTTQPKYKLISTHTGRRTFATNLLLQGVPAETVMMFTGHRDHVSFSKYVNIPKRTKMELVKNALKNMSIA